MQSKAYECTLITESADAKLLARIEDLISKSGGKVTNKDSWGEKNFAYRIGRLTKGHYQVWTVAGDMDLKDLKNKLNIEDGVVRYLLLKTA